MVPVLRYWYLQAALAYYELALAHIDPLNPDVAYIMLRITELNDALKELV